MLFRSRISGFVGTALVEKLVQRHGIDEETKTHLKKSLRQNLERKEEAAASQDDKMRKEIHEAWKMGVIDETFVEEVTESGEKERLIECLSLLVNEPRTAVEKVFASRSAKAVTALTWSAGLPMRVAFKIQTMVMKLPADELLPARSGVDYPLAEDEMRWHLSYFGFTKK